jgi:uncharacterized protein (DUF305 family)
MTGFYTFALAALLTAAALPALAQPAPMSHHGMVMPATPADGGASSKAFKAANDKMMKGMDVKLSGNADQDFVASMIPHHQGAIDMAKIELQHGTDPELRHLAQDIIAAQEKEIAGMTAWLAKHK